MSYKLTGNEKAFLGGLLAFLSTTIIQLQGLGSGYTLREFLWSLGAWIIVHLGVFLTTNSPVLPVTPPTPDPVMNGVEQLTDPSQPSSTLVQ